MARQGSEETGKDRSSTGAAPMRTESIRRAAEKQGCDLRCEGVALSGQVVLRDAMDWNGSESLSGAARWSRNERAGAAMEVLRIVRNGGDELRLRSEELCLDQSGSAMAAKRTVTMSIDRRSNGAAAMRTESIRRAAAEICTAMIGCAMESR